MSKGNDAAQATEYDANPLCPHDRDNHPAEVCAVHVALAEAAGIYDLTDDEAAEFVRIYERVTSPGPA